MKQFPTLVLEDNPERVKQMRKNWHCCDITHVDTVEAFKKKIKKHGMEYRYIFLDHDLGGEVMVDSHGDEPTGYDAAKYLATHLDKWGASVFIHSFNPVGADNIEHVLNDAGIYAQKVPGIWTQEMT